MFLFSLTLLSITLSVINLSLSFASRRLIVPPLHPTSASPGRSEHMALTTHDLQPENSSEKHKER